MPLTYGTLKTSISERELPKVRALAIAANVGWLLTMATVPMVPAEKVNVGALNSVGSVQRRRRWHMAYRLTLVLFGLPHGTQWVPCYLCGDIFHAWTMDGEHVVPQNGARVGNLLLACHTCNRGKHDTRVPVRAIVDKLNALAFGWDYPAGPYVQDDLFCAFDRRPDGKGMDSWKYGTEKPSYLVPVRRRVRR